MTEVWALPGYDVQALIGYGATGEVWRARELASGAAVALKRLRADADPTAIGSLRREAAVLRTLDTPYVVRLRAVLGEDADTVLVLDLATGGSLAALLSRRGCLEPGEVVTIAAPLAQALAAAHACGLVHGDVTPSNVLFTAEGMPLLADLGLARLAGESLASVDGTAEYVDPAVAAGGQPDAASDVWALAAVCHHLLSGTAPHDGDSADDVLDAASSGSRAPLGLLAPSAPRPLICAIESALQFDPSRRPDAAAFAAAIRRSHAAAPVRLTGGAPAAVPGPEIRETHAVHTGHVATAAPASTDGRRRRLLISVAALAVLSVAAGVGWLSGRAGEQASAARPVSSAAPDWPAVLDQLDAARATAFAEADPGRLLKVYAPTSPLLTADRAALSRLRSAHQRAPGVRHEVRTATATSYDTSLATLRVVDVLAAYDVTDVTGRVLSHSPARGPATFVVTLLRTGAGWRLQSVVPA